MLYAVSLEQFKEKTRITGKSSRTNSRRVIRDVPRRRDARGFASLLRYTIVLLLKRKQKTAFDRCRSAMGRRGDELTRVLRAIINCLSVLIASLCVRIHNEDITSATSVRFRISWDKPVSEEKHGDRMGDNRPVKIAKNRKPDTSRPSKRWCENWTSQEDRHTGNTRHDLGKKMKKKKKKTLVKIKDFKMHH